MTMCRKPALGVAAMLFSVGAIAQQQPPPGLQPPQPAPAGPQLLHPMFQDHAVLQRDRPIKVYGETAPGAAVTVTLGSASARGARRRPTGAGAPTLPAMAAGGPYTLTATANGETRTASDVLVGDVFFCAGQSNMAFGQRQAQGRGRRRPHRDRRADPPAQHSDQRQPDAAPDVRPHGALGGGRARRRWATFPPACYYFARELKKTVNVPVGMVVAAWGGARVRNWVSEGGLRRLGLDNDDLDMLALSRTDQQAALRRWGAKWESWWTAARPQRRSALDARLRRRVLENRAPGARAPGRCGTAPARMALSARCGCARP